MQAELSSHFSQLQIRHSEAEDITQILDIYNEPEAYKNTLFLPMQSHDSFQQKLEIALQNGISLVAVSDRNILGRLLITRFQARRQHVAAIGMGVKAAARRQGVGSALLECAIDLCEKWLQITRIELAVYTDNQPALTLYQKYAFVIEGTCQNYAFRDGSYADGSYDGENQTTRVSSFTWRITI